MKIQSHVILSIMTLCTCLLLATKTDAAVMGGTFHLYVTDPGSVPLATDFEGTYTFDGSAINPGNTSSYSIPLLTATIYGGDSASGCCYTGNTNTFELSSVYLNSHTTSGYYYMGIMTAPEIRYVGDIPLSINVSFQNDVLMSYIVLVGPNDVAFPNDPNYGKHWTEGVSLAPGSVTGIRGGIFTISNPIAAVPEPETYTMMLIGLGLIGFQLRHKSKQTKPLLLSMA
jgi:hypothetical protein